MDNKRYRRYFIILDNEDEGFDGIHGNKPKGYTKIEIKNGKGVLNHYIENFKYFDNAQYIYRGVLLGTKGGVNLYANNGSFIIDEGGKGQLTWKFDPENVDGQGNLISDFNIVAILAEPNAEQFRGKGVKAPLVGFINKKRVEWKGILENTYEKENVVQEYEVCEEERDLEEIEERIEYDEKADSAKEEQKKVEIIKEEVIKEEKEVRESKQEETVDVEEEKKEEDCECIVGEVSEEIIEGEVEEIKKEDQEVAEECECIVEDTTEEMEKEVEEIEEEVEEKVEEIEKEAEKDYKENKEKAPRYDKTKCSEMKSYDHTSANKYYQHYFKMVCGYVKNILKYYNEAEPFEKNIPRCKWWKIDCSQQTLYRNFLPFYGYIANMYYYYNNNTKYTTGCPDLIYKYQHYIFGIVENNRGEAVYYVYGIPGRYMASEQPYEGNTGFVYWHPLENKPPQKGDYGYWLLYIDAKTGNVAMPQKPTPPPR